MPLQSSGAISINDIHNALSSSSYSLRTLSAAAGFSTPDAMSEFYGYSGFPSGLVAGYNSASYSGSGSTWNDMSGNGRHMTLTNPSWNSTYGYFNTGSNTDFQVPGSTGLYNNFGSGSPFTWILRASWLTSYQDLVGTFWSESSSKNFLVGMWYPHTGSNCVPRVDSCCTYSASWSYGVPASNTGSAPSQASFDWTGTCTVPTYIVTKDTSNVFRFYGINGGSSYNAPTLLWTSNAYSDWGIGNTSQSIHLMCQSQGSYYSNARLFAAYMFNRVLSTAEMTQIHLDPYYTADAC